MNKGARIAADALDPVIVRSENKRPKLGFRDQFVRLREQPSGLGFVDRIAVELGAL